MKTVVLTSGPRGAGKSTYVDQYMQNNSHLHLLSRDKLLIELFGKTTLNPYTGAHHYAKELFLEKLEQKLNTSSEITLIVDYWNGFSSERKSLTNKFRQFGADTVICWKFITPKEYCLDWFMKKEESTGYTANMISRDYQFYHKKSQHIEEDGFDTVRLINPTQLELSFPEYNKITTLSTLDSGFLPQ